MDFRNNRLLRGSISMMLIVILIPMMTLSALIVDVSRINMAKGMVSSAGDLAMNAALTNYDSVLKDVYGLFAMSQTEDDLRNNVMDYFTDTLVQNDIVSEEDAGDYINQLLDSVYSYLVVEDRDAVDFLQMDVDTDTFEAAGVGGSQLSQPAVLKKQIVEYMKYRAPINIGMSFIDALSSFGSISKQGEVVDKQVKATEKTQDIQNALHEAYEYMVEYDEYYLGTRKEPGVPNNMIPRQYGAYITGDAMKNTFIEINTLLQCYVIDTFTIVPEVPEKGYKYKYFDYCIEKLEDDDNGQDSRYKKAADAFKSFIYNGYTFRALSDFVKGSSKLQGEYTFVDDVLEAVKLLRGLETEYVDGIAEMEADIDELNEMVDYYQTMIAELDPEDENYEDNLKQYQKKLDNAKEEANTEIPAIEADIAEYERIYRSVTVEYTAFVDLYTEHINKMVLDKQDAYGQCKVKIDTVAKNLLPISTTLINMLGLLKKADSALGRALDEVDAFDANLKSWESSANSYGEDDSFAESQKAEIDSLRNLYDKTKIQSLRTEVQNMRSELQLYFNYLCNATKIHYGGKAILAIQNMDMLLEALGAMDKEARTAYTEEEAKQSFDLVACIKPADFKDLAANKNDTAGYQVFTLLAPPCCDYAGSLAAAFYNQKPAGTSTTVKAGDEEISEDDYDNFKGEVAGQDYGSGSDGETAPDGTSLKDIYGYTYKGKSLKAVGTPKDESISKVDSENPSNTTEAQKSLLDTILSGLKSALESGRDNIYVMEYVFSNFSHNTSYQAMVADKTDAELNLVNAAGKIKEFYNANKGAVPETLSDVPLNDDYAYGAEIEYILYGNASAEKNVTTTKAMLFAIRFVFNTVFAFTDSSIKMQAKAIGAAVQAATLGVVPAPLVAALYQIALAAAETAIDLQQLSLGCGVAIVKTRDTWMLGTGGLKTIAKDTVKEVAGEAINRVAAAISGGLQKLVDCGADKLDDAITEVKGDLDNLTKKKIEEILDSMVAKATGEIENGLNQLMFIDDASANLSAKVDEIFNTVYSSIDSFASDAIAECGVKGIDSAVNSLRDLLKTELDKVKSEIKTRLGKVTTENFYSEIVSAIQELKQTVANKLGEVVESMTGKVADLAKGVVSDVQGKLNGYIGKKTDEARDKAVETTNEYIDKLFPAEKGTSAAVSGDVTANKNKGVVIKFDYDDYLRLFFFVGMVFNSDAYMSRIATLIESNIKNAPDGSYLKHKAGSGFTMDKSYTYVRIKADISLDMLFLKMDMFKPFIDEVNDEILLASPSEDEANLIDAENKMQFTYRSVMGY